MRLFSLTQFGAAIVLAAVCFCPRASRAADSISAFKASCDASTLHIETTASDGSLWSNTQLLIDADGDAKTGYGGAGADHGYDLMVEGSTVYRFKGSDPAAWSWDKVGTGTRRVDGGKLSLDVDLKLMENRSAHAAVLLRALSADYQTVTATSPTGGAATVDLAAAGGGGVGAAAASPPVAAPTSAPAGLSATVKQDGTWLVMNVTAATAADLNTVLIFFDTDENPQTGFNPPADPRFGFEMMIQGGSLSQHTGATRDGWSWLTVSPVKQSISGASDEIRFNASLLKSTKFKWSVWQMSADWQSRADFVPRDSGGLATATEMTLDGAKLHADASVLDVPMAPAHADAAKPARQRFHQANSYCCYYGPDRTAALSHVDAAILHTPAQTPAEVEQLNRLGVVTIGYLSVGEDESLRVANGQGPGGKASWYFDRQHTGKPEMNGTWGSYFANANDPAWRADRVERARLLCGHGEGGWGFDGIFLDTVETVDAYPESRAGMIQLIQELRAALPDKVIVMNRGFSLLKEPAICGSIDGMMYESFTESYDFDTHRYYRFGASDLDATREMMTSTVLPVVKQYGIKVLALDYCDADQTDRIQEAMDRAATFGMLCAVAPISLDAVYDTWDRTGHADSKYLAVMATPESMQVTMDGARDGFAAGTTVTPSSCFMGYSPAAVVDGIADRSKLDWMKASWASAEAANTPQWLLFSMPAAVRGGALKITFAVDGGRAHPSRDFSVEVAGEDGAWKTIAHPTNQTQAVFTCGLPDSPIRQIRITQAPGGGSADRPDLMWVGQVERVQ